MPDDVTKAKAKAEDDEVRAILAESAAEAVRTARAAGEADVGHAAVRGAVAEWERLLWKHGIGTGGQVRLWEAVGRADVVAAARDGQAIAERR